MKLYKILFEGAEEYYQKTYRVSGAINSELAADDLGRYKRRVKYIVYNPLVYTKDAAQETGQPSNFGGFDIVNRVKPNALTIDLQDKKIYFGGGKLGLHNPLLTMQLETVVDSFPEFREYNLEDYGKVGDLLDNMVELSGKFSRYRKGDESLYDELKFKVLKNLSDLDWYHATRESNLDSINTIGLLPSKAIDPSKQQTRGWTQFNFNLQNAVYLTGDIDTAKNIAKELADRYQESAVVLKIDGQGLKDLSKIVVDEDSLRDEYSGNVVENPESLGIPEYIFSIIDRSVASIGYRGVIGSEYITVVEKIEYNNEAED